MPTVRSTGAVAAVARAARIRKKWSQQQAADAAGVSRRFISLLESGEHRNAELWRVLAVLEALGVELLVAESESATGPGPAARQEPTTATFDLDQHLATFRKGADV